MYILVKTKRLEKSRLNRISNSKRGVKKKLKIEF